MKIKNATKNTFTYSGKVTLSQYIGTKKVVIGQTNNSGGKPLFDFLVNCFTGNFNTAKVLLPRKIGLYIKNTDGNISGYDFYGLITPAKKVNSTASNGTVRYSFSIPFEVISGIDSFAEAFIGLYPENPVVISNDANDEYENYLANFSLKDLNRSLFLNSALVVDWDLQVGNASTDYSESEPTD
jgi:hypothetical protein